VLIWNDNSPLNGHVTRFKNQTKGLAETGCLSINNLQPKNYFYCGSGIKSSLNIPISSNIINSSLNREAGALFKNLQQSDVGSKSFWRKNRHRAENKRPALYKSQQNRSGTSPVKLQGWWYRGLQAMKQGMCWPHAEPVHGALSGPNQFPCHSKQQRP
jgi:hypothetical protein